jgi:aminoglycoside phosphotransferase (APT) family kinase protein
VLPTLLNIPLHHLLEYAKQKHHVNEIRTLKLSPLTGGYVAANVYRLDLEFSNAEDVTMVSFVQKHTYSYEVHVMKLLAEQLKNEAIPLLIDHYIDDEHLHQNGASWFVSPFYDGHSLLFDDDMPLSVVKALASVHSFFGKHNEALDTLTKVDTTFVSRLLSLVLSNLDEHKERLPESLIIELHQRLGKEDYAAILGEIFERLPKTLTHGDVHAGNIIRTTDDKYILFDWGNARFAPAMLDLANIIGKDSDEWRAYLADWQEITGEPLDAEVARMGYEWATAVVNLQYLPYAIGYLEPDTVEEMLNKVTDAIAALQKP